MRVQVDVTKKKEEQSEDLKTRRRRLYKIISEEKPIFIIQERNFYSMVIENKDIVKILSMLNSCTQELKQVNHLIVCKSSKNLFIQNTRIFVGFVKFFRTMGTL